MIYDIKYMIIWIVVFFVVWRVLSWIFDSFKFKKHWWIILIIVIVGFLGNSYYSENGIDFNNLKRFATEKFNSASNSNIINDCEEKAIELIPESIRLYDFGGWKILDSNVWTDGKPLVNYDNKAIIEYNIGSKQGENVNYYYFDCSQFVTCETGKYSLSYSETVLDEEGNILGNNEFKIEPILKIIPDSEGIYNNRQTQLFEIIELNFISCNWIGENMEENKWGNCNEELYNEIIENTNTEIISNNESEEYILNYYVPEEYIEDFNKMCLIVKRENIITSRTCSNKTEDTIKIDFPETSFIIGFKYEIIAENTICE